MHPTVGVVKINFRPDKEGRKGCQNSGARAVRERTYKRFDYRSAAMGLSVQTAYKFRKGPKIKANSVLVTRVLGTESMYGQQISTQVKYALVTNPLPNTKSELVVISSDAAAKHFGLNLLQFAKPSATEPALTAMILSREEILKLSEIARAVEVPYCESKANYFPGQDCLRHGIQTIRQRRDSDPIF
jgi:hypothetical protein